MRPIGPIQLEILHVLAQWRRETNYGAALTKEVSCNLGRRIVDAQIYTALRRLEERQLIYSNGVRFEYGKTKRNRKRYALTTRGVIARKNAITT
jgi:DNA-binding PadR family transcriptional regulator